MNELDDRLAGDPTWELFPDTATRQAPGSRLGRIVWWSVAGSAVAAIWLASPPLAVATACLVVSARDFRRGLRLARSIPDEAGGTICARFTYGWAGLKFAMTALAFMFATLMFAMLMFAIVLRGDQPTPPVPPAFFESMMLSICGYVLSASFTAAGLFRAYRSGMRVWVGEGVNQARTLLLAMIIVAFTFAVLVPISVMLATVGSHASGRGDDLPLKVGLGAMLGSMLTAPFILLMMLDWICKHVVANRPGKFGPKVPAVGKWDS
jgi:hypothetical protein